MPVPWGVQATRAPTRVFDEDWTPNPEDPYSLRHSEYGHDTNPDHRSDSKFGEQKGYLGDKVEEPVMWIYLLTYISYSLLQMFGHAREFIGKVLFPGDYEHLRAHDGYAPLFSDWDSFYTRRLKLRIDDCFARPVTSVAGRTATLLDRTTSNYNNSFTFTGETTQALNVSSYNYLGFAQSRGPCADQAEDVVSEFGVTTGGRRGEVGTSTLHVQCERLMANFLGVEDCMIVSMGFATNSTTLPAVVSKGCLIISDELNHASIRFGARLSGAMVRSFKHNDMEELENLLREAISQGHPRTHRRLPANSSRPPREGDLANLPVILKLKEKYKFYLFMDEAHSIGALGPRGRGTCDYFGVDPRKVDLLMGTFTKSFGAAGGYIGGSSKLISMLRLKSHAENYAEAMAPPVVSQIITSTASIMGPSSVQFVPSLGVLPPHLISGVAGVDRIRRLAFNCRYVHGCLRKLGFIVYAPGKLAPFSRLMLERHNIMRVFHSASFSTKTSDTPHSNSVVLAAFPATPLATPRIRLCLSSAHTKDDLDSLLRALDDVGSTLGLKLSPSGMRMNVEDVIQEGVQMVRDYEASA
ncbi:serine palmitoyltransferase, partial [Phenoliferia sp. Uapishka_3]